jgi:hypothetical protein
VSAALAAISAAPFGVMAASPSRGSVREVRKAVLPDVGWQVESSGVREGDSDL